MKDETASADIKKVSRAELICAQAIRVSRQRRQYLKVFYSNHSCRAMPLIGGGPVSENEGLSRLESGRKILACLTVCPRPRKGVKSHGESEGVYGND